MKRLCIATDALHATGASRQIIGLVAHLQPEYETTVVCAREEGPLAHEARRLGAVVHAWNIRGAGLRRLKRRFLRLFRAHRPDVLHTFMPDADYPACWAARETGAPVIVSGRRTLRPPRWLPLQIRANQFVDRVIANSRVLADAASAAEDGDASRYGAIHDGCDPARSDLAPAAAAEGLAKDEAAQELELVAVTATDASPPACPAPFAEAARLASAESPNLRFLTLHTAPPGRACPRGPQSGPLVSHVAALEEREDFYRSAGVFLVCEPHHHLPFPALRAMASGAPLIAWKGSAAAELVDHEATGWLIGEPTAQAYAAALALLAAEPALASRLGVRAAQWAREERTLEHAAREHARCYRELLASKFHRGT